MKDSEIAAILRVTLQTAKVRLHRAWARLRKELTAACVFYHDERNELACDRKTSHKNRKHAPQVEGGAFSLRRQSPRHRRHESPRLGSNVTQTCAEIMSIADF
ncbi:MAG: hypothetical protein ACYC7J_04070 [Syntrophales bacterium]